MILEYNHYNLIHSFSAAPDERWRNTDGAFQHMAGIRRANSASTFSFVDRSSLQQMVERMLKILS
ncbi:hypothetical protein KIN20_009629, partial [Parelaphostrongylus tenuis]